MIKKLYLINFFRLAVVWLILSVLLIISFRSHAQLTKESPNLTPGKFDGGSGLPTVPVSNFQFGLVNKATAPANLPAMIRATEIESNSSTTTATPLSGPAVKMKGNIFPANDQDYYSFTAQAGDRVYAATQTSQDASVSGDSQLELFASDGTTIIESDNNSGTFNNNSSGIAGTLIPATGTYYLRVRHNVNTGTIRPYYLYFNLRSGAPVSETEANDALPGQQLPADGWVSGELSTATDVDFYSVTLEAGETIYISLDLDPARGSSDWNGRLSFGLFGDDPQALLQINDAGGDGADAESFFFTVKEAGTYSILVDTQGGTFGTYHLSVSTLGATTDPSRTTYTSTDIPVTIPTVQGIVSSTLTIPATGRRIKNLKVAINLDHTFMRDLDVELMGPDRNIVGLFSDIGGETTNGPQTTMDIVLDDEAGIPPLFPVTKGMVLQPELNYRLEWFKGQIADGTWTLTLRDDATDDGGTLNAWSLIIDYEDEVVAGSPTTVFSTDFESGDAGFTHSGTLDEWELGTPSFVPVTSANSGVNCFKTDLDNTYDASANQELVSPTINIPSLNANDKVLFRWAMKYHMESANFDHAFVEVREVGGTNAVRRVWEWLGPTMTNTVGNPAVIIEEAAGWGLFWADISAFAGKAIQLLFHLDSDTTVQLGGLAIDDVSVTVYNSPPVITANPAPVTVCTGSLATFACSATNAAGFTWQESTDNAFSGITQSLSVSQGVYDVAGTATSSTLTIHNTTGLNGRYYRCVASAGSATTASAGAQLTSNNIATGSISSLAASGSVGSCNNSVSVTGIGQGTAFVFTGPNGYVFSNVFRQSGIHTLDFRGIMQPGVYTIHVYDGSCGSVSQQITIAACP